MGSRRSARAGILVRLWMDILRHRSRSIVVLILALQLGLEQLQTGLDVDIVRIEIRRTPVGIQRIGSLVVA